MSYSNLNLNQGTIQDATRRLAEIADCAWRGPDSPWDLPRRYRYYDALFPSISLAERSFRVVEYADEKKNLSVDCAFVVILPLTEKIALKHLHGDLSQYSFSNSDLETRVPKSGRTYHYFQSYYRDSKHSKSDALKFVLHRDITALLKRQGCGRKGLPFTLYAETSYPKGLEIATRHGLARTHLHSFEHHPLLVLDSETGDAASIAKLRAACSK